MKIDEVKKNLANRLTSLREAKILAESQGQFERVITLSAEIIETEITITQLSAL
jgi:hypothetical protein